MASLATIFEKIASKDKDFRYMATSDLLNELQKPSSMEPETQKKICQVVLHQMEDQNGDISNLAVKCLAPLVKRVPEPRIQEILDGLCDKLLNGSKEPQRDIGGIGLKTVVSEISSAEAAVCVVKRLTPRFIEYFSKPDGNADVKSECLDILTDMVQRFGNHFSGLQEPLSQSLLPQLDVGRAGLRKRVILCTAALASTMSDQLVGTLCQHVIDRLQSKGNKADITRTYVQMIGALSKSLGYRFGSHLASIIPTVIEYCKTAQETDDEMREYALQALESFVVRCPRECSPFIDQITSLSLEFLSYDPNYNDDGDDEDEDMDEDDDDDFDDDCSDGAYSDDEDASWKTRQASAKCLSAVIGSRGDLLSQIYDKVWSVLVSRLKEREESVKVDVFNTFTVLLRQTGLNTSTLPQLKAGIPALVKAINRQLKEKSLKTKVAVFVLLKELTMVNPESLKDHFAGLSPHIERAISDKASSANIKIEALVFLRLLMEGLPPSVFYPHLDLLAPAVYAAVGERYHKVTSEALRVCTQIIKVVRPEVPEGGKAFNAAPFVEKMYTVVSARLTAQDQDQEVKECAILCTGLIVARAGDILTPQHLGHVMPMLLERLRNEITRLAAVRAFAVIAHSSTKVDLSGVIEPAVVELSSFLRKANRPLRQASLATLDTFVVHRKGAISVGSLESIITESASLITDSDLQLASTVLHLTNSILLNYPNTASVICSKMLPPALALVQSSLLQGATLHNLCSFFATLVKTNAKEASFDTLLAALMKAAQTSGMKQAGHSVALCVAGVCGAVDASKKKSTTEMLIGDLKSTSKSSAQLLSLLCLGEMGRRQDMGCHAGLEAVVTSSFQSPSEEIKSAAAYALGSIAVGNNNKYMPYILEQIGAQPKLQYLLFSALKEVMTAPLDGTPVEIPAPLLDQSLALLFTHCESEDEGVRNVVADCLGKLTLLQPNRLLPSLKERLTSTSANTRATMVMALKYTITDKPQPIDASIMSHINDFLLLIKDPDSLDVRRAAVQVLHVAAHNKPSLIISLLPTLLPLLYEQTVQRPELVRTVNLGPFKHIVDDGLELRKSAFECMDTLVSTCQEYIDTAAFFAHLKSGLGDHYDVKLPCHLILTRCSQVYASALLASLDQLIEPLEATLTTTVKKDAVQQEIDRNEDMLRSALRAVDALSHMTDIESCHAFQAFMKKVVLVGDMQAKFNAVKSESDTSGSDMMDIAN